MRVYAVSLLIGLTLSAPTAHEVVGQIPSAQPSSAREVAVTFDDLPLNGPRLDLARLQAMTAKLMAVVTRHNIPVVGFVNESQLYVAGEIDARINVLKQWVEAGAELGNHTFSHPSFKGASLPAYQDDVVRGDTVTKMLMKQSGRQVRYFRHPFLHMGDTNELESSFERFLAERGYRIAPVTVDTVDWMVLNAYNKARQAQSSDTMERVKAEYLQLAAERLAYSETMAGQLFGRAIKQILLLHANELNADTFESLVQQIQSRGYRFVTLEEALGDEAYRWPPKYTATSQWLRLWAESKDLSFTPPDPPESLR